MTSCPATLKGKNEARRLIETFNPSLQTACFNNPERSVDGRSPTLSVVGRDYGKQVAIDWLIIELNDYQNFIGVKEEHKATYDVVCELARMIFVRYFYLKLTELMLFFQKMKYGEYGEMYGVVDSVRILRALKIFVFERNHIIDKLEQKKREMKLEGERKIAITYEEYLTIKKERKLDGI